MHTYPVTTNAPLAGRTVAQMVLCALAVVSLLYLPLPILSQVAAAYQIPQEAAGTSLQTFGLAHAFGCPMGFAALSFVHANAPLPSPH